MFWIKDQDFSFGIGITATRNFRGFKDQKRTKIGIRDQIFSKKKTTTTKKTGLQVKPYTLSRPYRYATGSRVLVLNP